MHSNHLTAAVVAAVGTFVIGLVLSLVLRGRTGGQVNWAAAVVVPVVVGAAVYLMKGR